MEEINDNVKYNVHTDDINEIIGKVNNKMLNYGLTVFIFVIGSIFAFSWFIRYPDIINGQAVINAANAPKAVIAHTTGKIDTLVATEGKYVKKGEVLAYIESNTNPSFVYSIDEQLKKISDQLERGESFENIKFTISNGTNLAELQTSFQTFLLSYNAIDLMIHKDYFNKTKSEIVKNVKNAENMQVVLEKQRQIYLRDLELANQNYKATTQLYKSKVISPFEFRQEESKYLAKTIPLENINNSILNNKSAINADTKSLIQMDQELLNTKLDFLRTLKTFRNDISLWKKKYLVTAPISGIVSFSKIVEEERNVILNEEMFYIVPTNDKYYAEMWLAQGNFGKVKIGQVVKLKLESFPFQEYGSINGKVNYISTIAKDGVFLVKVVFPNLKTDEGKELIFRNGLKASGDIITEKNRLIEKMFISFKAIYKKI